MACEKQPLLDSEENDEDIFVPRAQLRNLASNEGGQSVRCHYGVQRQPTTSSQEQESDHIVSVFVVAFDTKAGNMLEWCLPGDMNLDGIEFKAMASGFHTLSSDFVYFCKDNLYGLACFENMPVSSEIERGARMKSVGILATSYTLLFRHMPFLETQVRHQLETPGQYNQLSAFYEDKKATLEDRLSDSSSTTPVNPLSSPLSELATMKITHPAGCFSQFIRFFGEHIFTLWKYVLLQKRILFFSPPPIGVVCYRVYCASCLGAHSLGIQLSEHEIKPYFYVNIADIDTLETEISYIACTTEKIFETKTQLYDVYIDNQNVTTPSQILRDLLKINNADRDKYQKLQNQRSALLYEGQDMGVDISEEEIFTLFFREQNNLIFSTLLEVSQSDDRSLTSTHMTSMGLDPVGDRTFIMELVETYGIDLMMMVDNTCCPR